MSTFKILFKTLLITLFVVLFNLFKEYAYIDELLSYIMSTLFLILAILTSIKLVKNIIVESAKSQLDEITELVNDRFNGISKHLQVLHKMDIDIVTYMNSINNTVDNAFNNTQNDLDIKTKEILKYLDNIHKVILKHMDVNYKLTNNLLKSFIVDMDKNQSDYLVSLINNKVEYITKVISTTQEGVLDSIETHDKATNNRLKINFEYINGCLKSNDKDLQLYIAKSISKLADAHYISNNLNSIKDDINLTVNECTTQIIGVINKDDITSPNDELVRQIDSIKTQEEWDAFVLTNTPTDPIEQIEALNKAKVTKRRKPNKGE